MSNVKKQRTLLLLDEPETHFNPDWRSKFMKIFFANLEAGGRNFLTKDIINYTHLFYNIRLSSDKVIICEKEKSNNATFNTFGTSIERNNRNI
jgi:energy-coupling factor transporter ATP-binding protein EcfA2